MLFRGDQREFFSGEPFEVSRLRLRWTREYMDGVLALTYHVAPSGIECRSKGEQSTDSILHPITPPKEKTPALDERPTLYPREASAAQAA